MSSTRSYALVFILIPQVIGLTHAVVSRITVNAPVYEMLRIWTAELPAGKDILLLECEKLAAVDEINTTMSYSS